MANELDILIRFVSQTFGVKPEEVLRQVRAEMEKTVDESERYQQTLEKMRVAQVMESQEKQKAIKWTQSHKDGQADLSKTLESLRTNVVQNQRDTEISIKLDKQKFASLQDVKNGFKGLAFEIPIVGQLLKLLNPFTAAVAGIAAATSIWRKRTDELVTSLGGVALPDLAETSVARAERMAAAIDRLASASARIKNEKEGFEKLLELQNAFNVAAGLTSQESVTAAKAANARAAAEALLASGQANVAASGNIVADNPAVEQMRTLAAAAEQQIPGVRERMHFIQRAQSRRSLFGFNPLKWYDDMIYGIRYGGAGTYEEGMAMEQNRLAGLQDTVSRYENLRTNRAARLALRSSGEEMIGAAANMFDQAAGAMGSVAAAQGKEFQKVVQQMNNADPLVLANAIARLATIILEAQKATDKAIADQERANAARARKP